MSEHGGKVLVVEDELLTQLDLTLNLEDRGLTVLATDNGGSAFEMMMTDQPIDVIFTDIRMPGSMDGIELAYHVLQRWPRTRVLITSGFRVDPMSLPANTIFIPKPYDPKEVARSIDAIARRRHQ